ncbi:DUF6492 family protein [Methylopila sp. M107]|uniref:DUF6492 family protein n=1 Tax=Methylopila sp. M107 TaxID=1101190 RepID=UPI00037753AC|nr:DUF6492 family protein [Methylopila sp. M107]
MVERPLTALLSTCSFRGDFDACKVLCESVDRFVSPEIMHQLIVPQQDLELFGTLRSPRRRVLPEGEFLPRGFFKIPMPSTKLRRALRLPRRDVYLTPYSLPVRGWIAQQLKKFAATAKADAEIVIHIDSDNAFIRPLTMDNVARDGLVRMYRHPERVALPSHLRWHQTAARLLGLPPTDWFGAEYINPMVVWRRSALVATIERIEAVTGKPWGVALARTQHFAEYVLYGVHADQVLGLAAAGLYPDPKTYCHGRWIDDFRDAADEEDFVRSVEPHHVTCLLQSTTDVPEERRRSLFARVEREAARQDAAAGAPAP